MNTAFPKFFTSEFTQPHILYWRVESESKVVSVAANFQNRSMLNFADILSIQSTDMCKEISKDEADEILSNTILRKEAV